jgi:hypothetical protein
MKGSPEMYSTNHATDPARRRAVVGGLDFDSEFLAKLENL